MLTKPPAAADLLTDHHFFLTRLDLPTGHAGPMAQAGQELNGMEVFTAHPEDSGESLAAGMDIMLQRCIMVAKSDTNSLNTALQSSTFYCASAPPITLPDFAKRLADYLHCSPESFVCAAIYIARLFQMAEPLFSSHTAHKLMLAASVCGAKWTDDKFYTNNYYAEVGGVPVQTLNKVEKELAAHLRFGFFIKPSEFFEMRNKLRAAVYAANPPSPAPVPAPKRVKQVDSYDVSYDRSDSTFSTEAVTIDDFLVSDYAEQDDVYRSAPSAAASSSSMSRPTLKRKGSWFDVLPSLTEISDFPHEGAGFDHDGGDKKLADPPTGSHSPAPPLLTSTKKPCDCFAPAISCADRPECAGMKSLALM